MNIDNQMLRIIELLSKTPFERFTIERIMKSIRSNYATTYRKIDRLIKMKVLVKSMYGMASQIRLNLPDEETISLLAIIENRKTESFIKKISNIIKTSIEQIINDTKDLIEFNSILIFGSYAKSKQTEQSDIDILVIFEPSKIISEENRENYIMDVKRSMTGILKTSTLRGGPEINPIIVSTEEHREMLLLEEQNVAKEALSNHIILKGFSDYWRQICHQKEK